MSLPPHLGSIQDIKEREAKAFNTQAMWHDQLQDVYEYFLPQRNLFDREDKGQKKMDRIFDSTALTAIQQGASKLQENIAPIMSRWATFQPTDEIVRLVETGQFDVSEEDIRANLDQQCELVFDYINRSNFHTQFYEAALDLLVGTATMKIEKGPGVDESLATQLGEAFRKTFAIGCAIEWVAPGELPTDGLVLEDTRSWD